MLFMELLISFSVTKLFSWFTNCSTAVFPLIPVAAFPVDDVMSTTGQ